MVRSAEISFGVAVAMVILSVRRGRFGRDDSPRLGLGGRRAGPVRKPASRCVAQLLERLPEVHPADWVAAYILLCTADKVF